MILFPECLIVPFCIFLHLIVAFKKYHVLDFKDSRLMSLASFFFFSIKTLIIYLLAYSLTKLDMDSSLSLIVLGVG